MSNPYLPAHTQRNMRRANQWADGRRARLAGLPCSSTNGAWLEGWYSVEPTKTVTEPPKVKELDGYAGAGHYDHHQD